jgi:hypothetical protein
MQPRKEQRNARYVDVTTSGSRCPGRRPKREGARACTERTLTPADPLPPRGGPASALLQPPPHLGPAPLTSRRTRVTLRETPRPAPRRPGIWIGSYRVHALDVVALLLGLAVVVAIVWPW